MGGLSVSEPVERLVGFGRILRAKGLPVGTGRIVAFCRAVAALDPPSPDDLYWSARAALIGRIEDAQAFDAAFAEYFGGRPAALERVTPFEPEPTGSASPVDAGVDPDSRGVAPAFSWAPSEDDDEAEGDSALRLVASEAEVLRGTSFDRLSEDEERQVGRLIRRIAAAAPRRVTRRLRPALKGRRLDLRRTLRRSLRTEGEPFRRAWRDRRTRRRPLILLLDVSGSMAPFSRALLQFAYGSLAAGRRVEVFCFGTRLTRVTRFLRRSDPDRALADVGRHVVDWQGGTRIGESIRTLLGAWGQRSALRGSVVLLCSDGLERGDPKVLEAQMARLSRLAHRVVWVNPLKGSPRYEPLARGMAAALPHVDSFLPGHDLRSLEALSQALRVQ
jgi:uncharacterized protein